MDNKNLPKLSGKDDCMGCSSCAQSCNKEAIVMKLNSEGYYNPFVDTEKCVGCKQCEKHCPVLNPLTKHEMQPKAYTAWIKNDIVREQSSSGGTFSALALKVLQENGLVWGAGYDEEVHPVYKCVSREEDLNLLRGSKYVQCEIGNAYKRIKQDSTIKSRAIRP